MRKKSLTGLRKASVTLDPKFFHREPVEGWQHQTKVPMSKKQHASPTRRILLWILIIVFWLIFFWMRK